MCIQYTITMASTRTPSAPRVTMQQNTQQVPVGQVSAGFPTGLQPPGLALPGLPAPPGLPPPLRFPPSHPSHPPLSHPNHPPPTHMAMGALPPQMPPPGYQEENLRYNPHGGYDSAYYENRPPNINRPESYYESHRSIFSERHYRESDSDFYYKNYRNQGQGDYTRERCDRNRTGFDCDYDYKRRSRRHTGDRFEDYDYDYEHRECSREHSIDSFHSSDYEKFRDTYYDDGEYDHRKLRQQGSGEHSVEHSLDKSKSDDHLKLNTSQPYTSKDHQSGESSLEKPPCISKDDQSDKSTQKPIEDITPKHEHFLQSTSVGVLELSEMEVTEVVKFIELMR